jgi:hypothetical protein
MTIRDERLIRLHDEAWKQRSSSRRCAMSDEDRRDQRSLEAAKQGLKVTLRLALLRRVDGVDHGRRKPRRIVGAIAVGAVVAVPWQVVQHWDSIYWLLHHLFNSH